MKQRYNVEVADIPLGIISDDGEEFVRQIADLVDSRVRDLTANTKYLSTVEAVILLALDYCGEKYKADRKIKSLETQVEILEANLRRLREENARAAKAAAAAADEISPAAAAPAAPAAPAAAPAAPAAAPAAASAEPAAAESAAAEPVADDPSSRGRKLRAIEELLGSQLRLDTDDE